MDEYKQGVAIVEHLRENKLGWVQVIAMDKIRNLNSQIKKVFEAPPNAKRVFDLIRTKEDDFKMPFYFAFGDTLVVKDIDLATKLGYE